MSERATPPIEPTPADAESLAAKLRALAATLPSGEQAVLADLLSRVEASTEVQGFSWGPSLFAPAAIIIVGGSPTAPYLPQQLPIYFDPNPSRPPFY